MMKEFTGADLSEINRVTVDVGSPLSRTTAGKLSILESLAQAGLIKNMDQYLQVLQTGTLEPAIEGETAELMLIRSENEKLGEGAGDVIAVATDNHSMHIQEHKSVLASPESRSNPAIVQATLAHIQEHINLLSTVDPNLLAMMGQQSLAPMPMAGGTPEMGEVMSAGPVTEGGLTNITELGGREAQMPGMPQNALTGEQYNPETGGL